MTADPRIRLITALQGYPFTVAHLMHVVGKPVSASEMAALLGRDKDTVGKYLRTLLAQGVVERKNYRTWQLAETGESALLFASESGISPVWREKGGEIPTSTRVVNDVVNDSYPSYETDKQKQQQQPGPTAKTSDFNSHQRLNLKLLRAAGVWSSRARDFVAEHPRANPRDIIAWAAWAFEKAENPGALIITNLINGVEPPESHVPPAICAGCGIVTTDCDCDLPHPHYPLGLLAARKDPGNSRWQFDLNPWGICENCGGLPCQCSQDASP